MEVKGSGPRKCRTALLMVLVLLFLGSVGASPSAATVMYEYTYHGPYFDWGEGDYVDAWYDSHMTLSFEAPALSSGSWVQGIGSWSISDHYSAISGFGGGD